MSGEPPPEPPDHPPGDPPEETAPETAPKSSSNPSPHRSGRRRPGRLRRWVVRPFVWLLILVFLLVVGLYELVQSRFARERVLALAVARTSEFLHRQVTIGSAEYSLVPWADIVLHDVRIPGPRPGDPPLATAELVHVALPWGKLQERVVELSEIDVVRPRLHLIFNPDGTSNLPQLGARGPAGPRRFEVRIGRILVQDGEFELNQRRVQLSLDARAVWGRMVGSGRRLDGLTTAQEVELDLPGARGYRASVSGKGSLLLDRGRFEIAAARVAGPDLQAKAKGTISWRRGPHVDIQYDADGASRLANRLGYVADPLGGRFAIAQGRVQVEPGTWSFGGDLTSPKVDFREWTVTGLAARFDGRPRGVDVAVRRAAYGGGAIDGRVFVDLATPSPRGKPVSLDFNVKGVAVETVLLDEKAPLRGVSGVASGRFVYRTSSSAPLAGNGRADVRVTALSAVSGRSARSDRSGLPIDGQGTLALAGGNLTSRDIRLTAPNQAATAELAVDLGRRSGRLDIHLDTADAPAIVRLIPREAPRGEPPPFWLPTAGHGHAEGRLAFAPGTWSFGLGLDLAGAASPALTSPASVRGSLTLTPAAVEGLAIDLARGGSALSSLHVAGRVPFAGPGGRYRAGDQIALTVDASSWPAGEVARFLSPQAPAVSNQIGGIASGHVALGGTPDRLTGRADAIATDLSVAGYALGRGTAALSFSGTSIAVERAALDLPAGPVHATGSFDTASKAFSLDLDAPALALARPPMSGFTSALVSGAGTAEGSIAVHATGSGTLDRPNATLTVRGRGLAVAGRRLGEAGDVTFEARWDGGRVEARGELPGLATLQGGGRLDRRGADLALDVASGNLPGLARLAAGRPLPAFTGGFAGRATLMADFASRHYDAQIALQDLHAEIQGRKIQNAEPVVLALEPGRLAIRSLYLREPTHDTELIANGTVGFAGGAPLDFRLQSTVWIGWLELVLPDLDVDGFVDALATVRGTVEKPELNGEAVLRGARLVLPGFPHAFENVRGEILFSRDEVIVDQKLLADVAGGTVGLAGSLRLPAPGRKLSYQAHLTAEDVSVRYPEGFLTRGGADVLVTSAGEGEGGGRQIAGRITLDRAYYLNDVRVGTLELLQRVFSRQRVEVEAPPPLLASTQLNLVVAGPDALRVHNNVADVRGAIDLTVRGSLARPVVFGRVELVPNGKLTYAGNEYRIERGLLTFSNPYKIDPVIDLVAKTEVQSFEITLALSGTVDRLDAHFSSNANLADLEILALLATGQELPQNRTGSDLSQSPINPQQPNLGAQGFLYGQAASAISQRVGTLFGLDRFRINPVANQAGQSVSGVGITVGKRLSRDVFVTYSSDPTAVPPEVLQIQWKLSPKFTLLLTQTGGRSYAVDGQWERRF
jgi:hypothetical protein